MKSYRKKKTKEEKFGEFLFRKSFGNFYYYFLLHEWQRARKKGDGKHYHQVETK